LTITSHLLRVGALCATLMLPSVVLGGSPDLVWLGVTRSASAHSLHIAARRYTKSGSPSIWLVGVSHLGDASYYEAVDKVLDESDVVIFEAVLPEGAVAPTGLTDAQRRDTTKASLKVLAEAASTIDPTPASLSALAESASSKNRIMANIVRRLNEDAWGNPVEIVQTSQGSVIRSLGADGLDGGDGSAADVEVVIPPPPADETASMQRELAHAMRMHFQLDRLPYERPNWVPGDMSAQEVSRRLSSGGGGGGGGDGGGDGGGGGDGSDGGGGGDGGDGGDGIDLGGMLTGSSLSGKVAIGLIRMMPAVDAMSGGRAIDGLKLMMIEVLSNPDIIEQGMAMYGEQLEQVILHDRNDVAIEATNRQLDRMAPDAAVAVLYGAAHMPGLDASLQGAGWEAVETRWLPAITVDLTTSNLDQDDIDAMRQMSEMAGSMFGGS
jgi:uncharacterized membrane protein YgcG